MPTRPITIIPIPATVANPGVWNLAAYLKGPPILEFVSRATLDHFSRCQITIIPAKIANVAISKVVGSIQVDFIGAREAR